MIIVNITVPLPLNQSVQTGDIIYYLPLLGNQVGGFTTQAVSDSGDTTLSVSDGSTGATLSHRIIEFTGSLTSSRNVTIPIDVQQFYILKL